MRHGVRVGVDGPPRGARRRHRRVDGAAGDGAATPAHHGLEFPLIHADAELVPCRDAAFDLAISEYGACLWADPDRWLPEAARLLRRGGECVPAEDDSPATDRLLRPAFGMFRIEWPGDPGVEFHLSHGAWIQRLRASGFEIEELIEVRPPETATTQYPFVTLEWSRRWPAEEIWRARRR
jgi:SAM-dependent methyltransferase